MSALRVYLPRDSVAISLGADEIAATLAHEAKRQKIELEIIRTGSRGMHWLEPLLECDSKDGRIGLGPLEIADSADCAALLTALQTNPLAHPRSVGLIEDIPFLRAQTRLIFARCGITCPNSLSDYRAHGGWRGFDKAKTLSPAAICEAVLESGLRGRGGAGFPAGIKWNTVRTAQAEQKYIVVNADEGDSGTFADRMIMEGDPFLLIEGMLIAARAVGASKGFIYLRSEYPIAETILHEALQAARAAGILGGADAGAEGSFDIALFVGAGSYVCGEETALLNSLEGKRGEVRAKPPIPALSGLFGKPTLVHNVISICAVPAILAEGAAFYRDLGMGKSTGTMPFQIAGNVKQGGLFEAPFGITLDTLINRYGKGTKSGRPVRAIQIGGPLGAYLPPSLFHLPIDYETLRTHGAGVGHGGIVIFDDSIDLWEQARYAFEFCVEESCGKCTPCRIGAVRGVELMDKIRKGEGDYANQRGLLDDLCELMVDGSLCAMGGMTPIPVQSALKHFPSDFHPPGQS